MVDSCKIDDQKQGCCSSSRPESVLDIASHWDKAYEHCEEEKLGWFETDLSPSLELFEMTGISKEAKILNVGAGNSRLIDAIVQLGFTNVMATDISKSALDQLQDRLGERVSYIHDDLTSSSSLINNSQVDFWIDRAVLHFFTGKDEQNAYLNLLNGLVKSGGYVMLAEFAEDAVDKCSGLAVHRYSIDMMKDYLGSSYKLVANLRYDYIMPTGGHRPYNYGLFRRK